MIKKLDKLVVRAFIGPFIATFFLTLFVLILQFFWLWIDDFVGKGIDGFTITRLIVYLSATLVPLALPLAVLLSSIMTFGNLGETFELVAIKSAGIGLLRFMRPLFVAAALLTVLAFLFNNYVIPVANLKMRTLHTDLVNKKPAFDLKEGIFYTTIPGYAIKVAKKTNDSTLNDVIIYESSPGAQDNITVARKGLMHISADKRFLELTLKDGWTYQEQDERTPKNKFLRIGFKDYKKVLDLSALTLSFSSDSAFRNRQEMLSVRQLSHGADSVEKILGQFGQRSRSDLRTYLPFTAYVDSGWMNVKAPPIKAGVRSFTHLLPDSARNLVQQQGANMVASARGTLEGTAMEYEVRGNDRRMYLMEWHSKYSFSLAVMVMFLIGAPLGSIVRKGGIGTPVIFAVIFFVIFFLLNNFGRKFVKEGVLRPVAGMWLATFVLLPIGFFLIYKALHDSQLFNKEFYYRFFRGIRKVIAGMRKGKTETELT